MTNDDVKVPLRLVMAEKNLEQAMQCGDDLARMGFKIVHVSERGVDFEGELRLAEETFHVRITMEGDAPHAEGAPELPQDFRERARGVYVPTRPTFLT